MRIIHEPGVDLNSIKMHTEDMALAMGLLPACLVDYVVEAVLDDLIQQAQEDNRPQDVEPLETALQIHRGEIG